MAISCRLSFFSYYVFSEIHFISRQSRILSRRNFYWVFHKVKAAFWCNNQQTHWKIYCGAHSSQLPGLYSYCCVLCSILNKTVCHSVSYHRCAVSYIFCTLWRAYSHSLFWFKFCHHNKVLIIQPNTTPYWEVHNGTMSPKFVHHGLRWALNQRGRTAANHNLETRWRRMVSIADRPF